MSEVDTNLLSAPYTLEYTYTRTTGPVIGRFLTSLRAGKIEGVKTQAGRVLVPPLEYDPETGEATTDFVEVGQSGTVKTWSWIAEPRRGQPLDRPFAWALIQLDGADTALLHDVIEANLDDPSFWLRKAIGWALRSHARVDPDWVRAEVAAAGERMSGLSRREALKHLGATDSLRP